jgi:hypothetical protein
MINQSIFSILGPLSDPEMFVAAMQSTAAPSIQSSTAQFLIYGTDKTYRKMMVTFNPASHGQRACCSLSFKPSQAISLDEIVGQDRFPKALVCAEAPNRIQMINESFSVRFVPSVSRERCQTL